MLPRIHNARSAFSLLTQEPEISLGGQRSPHQLTEATIMAEAGTTPRVSPMDKPCKTLLWLYTEWLPNTKEPLTSSRTLEPQKSPIVPHKPHKFSCTFIVDLWTKATHTYHANCASPLPKTIVPPYQPTPHQISQITVHLYRRPHLPIFPPLFLHLGHLPTNGDAVRHDHGSKETLGISGKRH